MRIAKSSLLALCAASTVVALAATASAAGLWKPGLQQKTCASIAWRAAGAGSRVLNVWNTDGSVLQLENLTISLSNAPTFPNSPGAVAAAQALVVAACSPRMALPDGHKYWVSVDNPNLAAPHATHIIVTYPPTDTPPVLPSVVKPTTPWGSGLQTKTCAAIEWQETFQLYRDPYNSDLYVHNTDGSVLALYGVALQAPSYHNTGPYAATPEQLAIIDACGTNASVNANRNYRASVSATEIRLVFQLQQQ